MLALKGLKKRIIPYFAVLSVLFTLSACSGHTPSQEVKASVIPVIVQRVSAEDIYDYTQISGMVKPRKVAYVVSPIQGKVASACFDVGDRVSEGDLLFTIDSTEIEDNIRVLEEQLKVAQANLDLAQTGVVAASGSQYEAKKLELQAALKSAEDNFTAAKQLLDTATVMLEARAINQLKYSQVKNQYQQALNALNTAREAYDLYESKGAVDAMNAARDQYKQAQASYDMLKLQIENARKQLSYTRVTAPMDGIIMTKEIVPGCLLSNTMVPYTIMDADKVQVVISVTEKVIGHIRKGQELEISIPSAQALPFKGKVVTVSPAVDNTMAFQVCIEVDNTQQLIKPGMTARVNILTEQRDNSVVVPASAILSNDTGSYVYVCEDETAIRRPVTTGITDGDRVEIVKGLSQGELLIVKGQQFLNDKTPVKVSGEVN